VASARCQQRQGDQTAMIAEKPAREITRTYEPFDEDMPTWYRDAVVRILHVQARIETEYPMYPERTLLPAMRLAPSPEDWVRYASYWAQEVEHASYWLKMLDDLGVKVDEAFMSTPKPIYIFDMRDEGKTWSDWAFFSFFADRQGAYMAWEWIGSSYGPFERIAERAWREEEGHAQMGYEMLCDVCASPSGRAEAQEKLATWYPAGLDMFGRSDSTRQYDYIRWGLRRRTNEEMRQAFRDEVDAVLRKVGLTPPDPLANRRFV
jgi:ring-1,2-phenylacetyl-CoA epoxidase subunit PaaA